MVVSSKAITAQRVIPMPVPSLTAVTPDAAVNSDAPTGINEAVERIAAEHSLPPQLIHSVIKGGE